VAAGEGGAGAGGNGIRTDDDIASPSPGAPGELLLHVAEPDAPAHAVVGWP
jgi:hypothetical protein